jgi:hypothetical protein
MTPRVTKTVLACACALAVLAACGQRGASENTGMKPEEAAAAPVTGASAQANAQRMASYALALAPLVAGSYGGSCMTMQGPAPKEGVTVSSGGVASAPGFSRNLASVDDSLVVSRTASGGVTDSAAVLATSNAPKWTLGINNGPQQSAMFGDGEAMTTCQQVPQLGLMKAKGIYPALARFFTEGATTQPCVVELASTRDIAVSAAADGVTIDGKRIGLDRAMKKESATLDAGARLLSYNAEFEDGTLLNMSVDDSGKIVDMASSSQGKVAYMCRKAQA